MEKSMVGPESKTLVVNLKLREAKKLQKAMADITPDEEIVPEDEIAPEEEVVPPEEEVVPEDKPDEEIVPEDKPEEEVTPEEEVVPEDKPEEEVTPEEEVVPEDKPDEEIVPEDKPEDPECEKDIDSDSDSESSSSSSSSDSDHECTVCNRKISSYASYKQHLKGKKHAKAVAKRQVLKKLAKRGAGEGASTSTEADDEYSKLEDLLKNHQPYAVCKNCDKEFGGPESYAMHLKSKAHRNKSAEATILDWIRGENGEVNPDKLRELCKKSKETAEDDVGIPEDSEFECKLCDKEFNGLAPYTQHLSSKTHARKLKKDKLLHEVIPEDSSDNLGTLTVEDDVLVCKACTTSFNGPENAMTHLKSKKHQKSLKKFLRKKKHAKRLEKTEKSKSSEAKPEAVVASTSKEEVDDDHLEEEEEI